MKFLHIIHLNEQNSYQLFKQLYDTYDLSEHTFLVFNTKKDLDKFPGFKEFKEFIYLPERRLGKIFLIFRLMKQAKYIIFNSLFFNSNKQLIATYILSSPFLHKAAWMEWGGDLYNWKKSDLTIKNKIIDWVNYRFRKKMKVVGVTFEADVEEVHAQFGKHIECFFTPLPFGKDRLELLERTRPIKQKNHRVRIQIAHNSLQVNNHISILSRLENFRNENIQLVLPLNYGTFGIGNQYGGPNYRNSVIACAKCLFGNNVSVLSKKLELSTYLTYLWKIDIAIFECIRPIALANIYYMLYMGKKVYLPSDSVHYKYFKRIGLPVHDTYQIQNQTFEEFIDNSMSAVPQFIIDKFTPGKEILYWGEFFKGIEKTLD